MIKTATIRPEGSSFYISYNNGLRSRRTFKTETGAERAAVREGYDVTFGPRPAGRWFTNLMSGKKTWVEEGTPWHCNPASHDYWEN